MNDFSVWRYIFYALGVFVFVNTNLDSLDVQNIPILFEDGFGNTGGATEKYAMKR